MFVTNSGSGTVSVINTATVTATIGVGDSPYGVAVSPTTGDVYVTNLLSDTVSVLSG